MSGTPVLAKPQEVYNIIQILRPDLCPTFKKFADRYCDPKPDYFRGVDYSGASATLELHYLLTSLFMIRRLKKDVLD
jgi:SWI/SNF-related matrix-associated actin-dependent regulator of chromatin subfamily A-like protein 1